MLGLGGCESVEDSTSALASELELGCGWDSGVTEPLALQGAL